MREERLKAAHCPFCAADGLTLRHDVLPYAYVACRACGVVSLFPFPSSEEIAAWYETPSYFQQGSGNSGYVDYTALRPGFHRTFQRRNRFLGKDFWTAPRQVLEIGCALGFYPEVVAKFSGVQYRGLDLNEYAVNIARQKGFAVECQGIEDVAEREHFDAVVFFDVLEHVPDPRAFLRRISGVLKKGGRILLTTPSTRSFLAKISGARWVSYIVPHHIMLYEPNSLKRLLVECGFGQIRISSDIQWVPLSFINERMAALVPFLKCFNELFHAWEARRGGIFLPVFNGNMLVTASRG